MSNARDNAIIILRYMLDNDLIYPRGLSPRALGSALGINENEIDIADDYLLQSHFVEGSGGLDGDRCLTPFGVQFISSEMKSREPLSLDSERVLKFLIREIKDNEFLTQDEILKGVNISMEHYLQACQQLSDLDFVKIFSSNEFPALSPTKLGRQATNRNFQKSITFSSIQAGAIFNGPITGANIQAIASVVDSQIQQNVSSLSPEELYQGINQSLEKLLAQMSEELTLQQKAAYTQLAAEFQKEILQPEPDPGKLHKFLASLGILSDLGGTIEFSQKTFELSVKAAPYIILLGQMALQVLKNATH